MFHFWRYDLAQSRSRLNRGTTAGKSKDEIADAYDSPPWWYDLRGFLILTFAYNSTLGHQLRFFGKNFGTHHLEIACGTGTLLEMALRWRRRQGLPDVRVQGIDYAEPMLAGAVRRFRRQPMVELRHADAGALPFDDATFDTANIANAVHCLPAVDAALRETFRVLKPGGTLAANVLLYPRGRWPLRQIARRLNDWGMRKGILYTPYARDDIRARFSQAGFEVIADEISGNCYDILGRRPA